jgi:hypothetical protein
MSEQKRKIVAFFEQGSVSRGYITVHSVNEDGQETQTPRDVELTPEQIDLIRDAIESVMLA